MERNFSSPAVSQMFCVKVSPDLSALSFL
jgi:hypothetical protein